MFCCAKVIAVEMECFNDLLHKLKEVHEREIEGKWKKKKMIAMGIQEFHKIIPTHVLLKRSFIFFFLQGWQVKVQELSNKKGW